MLKLNALNSNKDKNDHAYLGHCRRSRSCLGRWGGSGKSCADGAVTAEQRGLDLRRQRLREHRGWQPQAGRAQHTRQISLSAGHSLQQWTKIVIFRMQVRSKRSREALREGF